jgi:hypothetical protein
MLARLGTKPYNTPYHFTGTQIKNVKYHCPEEHTHRNFQI